MSELSAVWKRRAKLDRSLKRRLYEREAEWREALRLSGIGMMGDFAPENDGAENIIARHRSLIEAAPSEIAKALEAEWYNGNIDEHVYDRLLAALHVPLDPPLASPAPALDAERLAMALHQNGLGTCMNWEPGYGPDEIDAEMDAHRREAERILAALASQPAVQESQEASDGTTMDDGPDASSANERATTPAHSAGSLGETPNKPGPGRLHCPHCGTDWSEVAVVRNARAKVLDDVRREVAALRVDEIIGAPLNYERGWNAGTAAVLRALDRLAAPAVEQEGEA